MKRFYPDPGDDEVIFDEAWEALDAGEPADCLELLERCHPDEPARYLIACRAHLDLGEHAEAREALALARRLGVEDDDPDWVAAQGELLLFEWQIEPARALFEALVALEPSAYAFDRLALCADLEDDPLAADRWLAEAHRVDPELIPPPRHMSSEEFGRVIEAALTELSAEHRASIESTPIIVEPVPFRELAPEGDPLSVPPDALGMFVGPSLVDEAGGALGDIPPAIYLFQRNLERVTADAEELEEEIRTTLFHEIGHRLGYDESGIDELGLG